MVRRMDRPLRVVMPALTFVPGAMGGSETYARALVASLDQRDDVDLTVIVSRAGAGALGARSEHVVRAVRGGPSTLSRLATMARGARGDRQTRELLEHADVVHYPFTVPAPLPPSGIPWVVTLHDVQHRDLKSMFSTAERAYRRIAYDASSRRATRVITVSEFCRERIHARLGLPTNRIDVAHLGVDLDKFSFQDGPREQFVFYPATAWPHKNHERLIAAMELARRERPDLRLVLTGGLRDRLEPLPEWAEHRGYVTDAELVTLYRSGGCLAFPSLYEGFGLPVLEAMASGCPVAPSSSGSLPELCGHTSATFDPYDVPAAARAIAHALQCTSAQQMAARNAATRFTWTICAERHVRIFLRAISKRG